ncbi:MAG TPA: signal peptidase II [bacterium]|nr:signal peptidase II [bacterium]
MIFFVILLDQASKAFALRVLSIHQSVPVIQGLFHLTLVHNTGIAFGFFREHPGLLLVLITLSLLLLGVWAVRMENPSPGGRLAFALILGGAVGNWIDRLRFGSVIDFLDFRVWPVFNIADSAITIGVVWYLLILMRGKKQPL